MKTEITDSADEAAEFIRAGGIVAFPTETVYGLGGDAFNEAAIARIFEAKRRPADNPLIVHIHDRGQIDDLASEVSPEAQKLIERFFPGPLTVVLKRSEGVPLIATAGLDSVGVRMPRYDLAQRFLKACDTPVAAPSANLSGRPSPTTWQAVREDLDGRVDCILKGDAAEIGLESTVVDCTGDIPVLLRPGSVSLDELRQVVPTIVAGSSTDTETARSPGMRHRHYSPAAVVKLLEPGQPIIDAASSAFIGLSSPPEPFALKKICQDADEYARELFEFFRECDRRAVKTIYCETVSPVGIGVALMDRLRRASVSHHPTLEHPRMDLLENL
jgi:L-threonylcarbamoyladenylate synthase